MSLSFDDYHRLLGIEVDQIPPTHYQLLNLSEFEDSQERIQAAVMRFDSLLRTVMQGPDVASAQQMLNLIAAARICLTNESAKITYDEALKAKSRIVNRVDQSSRREDSSNGFEIAGTEFDTPRVSRSEVDSDAESNGDAPQITSGPLIKTKVPVSTVRPAPPQAKQHRFWFTVALSSLLLVATLLTVFIVQKKIGSIGNKAHSSDPIDIQQKQTKAISVDFGNDQDTKQRREKKPREQQEKDAGLIDIGKLTNAEDGVVNFDVLPFSDGLSFWLDANDEKTLEMDGQNSVYCWKEKLTNHRSTSRLDFPKRVETEFGKSAIAFEGNVGFCFNRFIEFAPNEFTIIYIADGTGVLLAKGDPHLEPEAAFAIDSKKEMRIRTASRKYLSIKNSSADHFVPRAILVSKTSIRLIDSNGETVERDWNLQLNNRHPISVGMLQSGDSSRVKKNLFHGKVGEIMIFNRALKDTEARKMMNYLFAKWLGD